MDDGTKVVPIFFLIFNFQLNWKGVEEEEKKHLIITIVNETKKHTMISLPH